MERLSDGVFKAGVTARVFENPRASTKWLAMYFKNKVQEDPKFKSKDMKNEVQRDLKVNVSVFKCKRAKKLIMDEIEGSFRDEFANLEAYCNELKLSNPGSDVCVEVSKEGLEHGRRIFKRMYVCFNVAKVGWKEGCRPLIGVDGTFLKGKTRGILLTTVGVGGNDSLYPLALGLVEKENAHHWSWFLQWLQKSLDLGSGENVTLMSDMQKGLVNAVSEVLPGAEHRFCARHIYANWSKKWRGNEFKKKFFSCAWSSYVEELKDNLKCLGSLRKEAATDAVTYPIQFWVRAYFSSRCKSWVVDNNMSESFNAWIDEYRFLPIIRMFDGIRLKMMAKWADSERHVHGWKSNFSPKCMDLFETNRFLANDCRVCWNGDDGYEIVEGQDRHVVHISRGMCTCKAWDLTGIPFQHAICAMYHAKIDPMTHISHYYHKDTYIAAYRTKLQPVRGRNFWDTQNFGPLQPPLVTNLPGRPPKKRTRTEEAERRRKKSRSSHHRTESSESHMPQQGEIERLSKRGKTQKCSRCNKPGHNRSSCKEAPSRQQQPKATAARRNQQPPHPPQATQQQSPTHSLTSQQPLQPTQDEPNTKQSSQPAPSHAQPSTTRRTCTRHARGGYGFGIRFDEATGRTVYNPGLNSELVIDEGTSHDYMRRNADPQTQFPISNERDLRLSRVSHSSEPTGSRSIQFQPQSVTIGPPSDLPFQPRGLQWRGQPCVTTSQLLSRIRTNKDKGKRASN